MAGSLLSLYPPYLTPNSSARRFFRGGAPPGYGVGWSCSPFSLAPWLTQFSPEPDPLRAARRSYLAWGALRGSEPGLSASSYQGQGRKRTTGRSRNLGPGLGRDTGLESRYKCFPPCHACIAR